MKRTTLGFLALAAAIAITPVAMADTISMNMMGAGGTPQAGFIAFTLNATGGIIPSGTNAGDFLVTGGSGIVSFYNLSHVFTGESLITGAVTSGLMIDTLGQAPPQTGNPSGAGTYDDLIIPNGTGGWTIDGYGPVFTLANGEELQVYKYINPNNLSVHYYGEIQAPAVSEDEDPTVANYNLTTFDITKSPEPSSLLLLGTGLLGLAGVAFRRGKLVHKG